MNESWGQPTSSPPETPEAAPTGEQLDAGQDASPETSSSSPEGSLLALDGSAPLRVVQQGDERVYGRLVVDGSGNVKFQTVETVGGDNL